MNYLARAPGVIFRLVSQPLNASCCRSGDSQTCSTRFLNLGSPILRTKYDDYINAFAPGTTFTFSAASNKIPSCRILESRELILMVESMRFEVVATTIVQDSVLVDLKVESIFNEVLSTYSSYFSL